VRRERSSGLPGGRGCWSARGSCAGVRAGVRRTCTCAPEAAAVAASSSSGSDDRAVRQLRHPAASVITLLPTRVAGIWPAFCSAATASWWDLAAFAPLALMIVCRCNSSHLLSVGLHCMTFSIGTK